MLHPQPSLQGRPYEGNRHDNSRTEGVHRHDRPFRRDHQRFRDRNSERPMDMRPQPPQERQHEPVPDPAAERRREKFQPAHEQPDFLRRPVRRARSEGEAPAPTPNKDEPSRD
jgi:hypothetical protein